MIPLDTAVEICGLWVATDVADYFVYPRRNPSPYHKDFSVLHEVIHMLAGHPSRDLADLTNLIHATPYTDAYEQEADHGALLILERAGEPPAPAHRCDPDVERVLATFGADHRERPVHPPRVPAGVLRRLLRGLLPG